MPITKLPRDILLHVFECLNQDYDATLVPSILCCKQWRPLAETVLYGDVFLNTRRLTKLLDTFAYTSRQIRSLTLVMEAVRVNPYDYTLAIEEITTRLNVLQRLSTHIEKMGLISLSISIDLPYPYTPSRELASIISHLPNSCICLDIDGNRNGLIARVDASRLPSSHLCDSIRAVLPRLRHFRVRYPQVCSALFGTELDNRAFEAVRAPNLRSCLINLSLREPRAPTSAHVLAAPCNAAPLPINGVTPQYPLPFPPLIPRLREFARLNSATLERLWIIDIQPRNPEMPNYWGAWVRRDFLLDSSMPIPMDSIRAFVQDSYLARVPAKSGGTVDWISTPERLEALAEDGFWSQTTNGTRLATPMLREYDCVPMPSTKEECLKKENFTCTLWQNEQATGEKLFPEAPGPLVKEWDIKERVPAGWRRDNWLGAPMVRL